MVRAIAALDESFRQGELELSEYRSQRGQLKARILGTSDPLDSGQDRDAQ